MEIKDISEDIWIKYKKTGDKNIREQIILHYLPLVKHVVGRLVHSNFPKNDYEDILNQAVLGLITAVERFDINKGVKFSTYATLRIRGEVLDYFRSRDFLPRTIRKKYKNIEEIAEKMEKLYGRNISDQEIAEKLGMNIEEYNRILEYINIYSMISLEEVLESNLLIVKMRENYGDNPEDIVNFNEIKNLLANSINSLPEKERMVITLYYYEDLTYREISKILGISESRISQLHSKAILRLRGKLAKYKSSLA